MPGMLTRIKVIYPVWLPIKWLAIVTIVTRSAGCEGDFGSTVQIPPLRDGRTGITVPCVAGMAAT